MKAEIFINSWTAHHNMFLYSLFFNKDKFERVKIIFDKTINLRGIKLNVCDKVYYFDYSDSPELIDLPSNYCIYFKRSYSKNFSYPENVNPLGFQVNYSHNPMHFFSCILQKNLFHRKNFVELIRSLDIFSLFTSMSHYSMQYKNFPNIVKDNGGKILYYTRLWDPARNDNKEEKMRREKMNHFRINAVQIIKKYYPDSNVGLYPCELGKKLAPDLILDKQQTYKMNYFKLLKHSDICIADDGLLDTLGWKIGEYVMFGKSIISTPINIVVPNFERGNNYLELSSRTAFEEIPRYIEQLRQDKDYMKMGVENIEYGKSFLSPSAYFKNIFSITKLPK